MPWEIVELRSWEDNTGQQRHSLATRSDLPLDQQVTAEGATWLDRHLIGTLRQRELDGAIARIAAETGLSHMPSVPGDHVTGIYRQRLTLASGRFAMMDDGLGFQLVPWRPAPDPDRKSTRLNSSH